MKIAMVVIAVVILLTIILVFAERKSLVAAKGSKARTLEEKLAVLEECGLRLASPFTTEDLLESFDREQFEEEGFGTVLVGLGMTEEQEPWRNHCINLWHFDTECIQDHGDYKRIAERMSEMAQGSLPLENIQDFVDIQNSKAWLSFAFRGQDIKIDCEVKDDWVDPKLFSRFVDLLSQSGFSKVYVYLDLGGQDCIIGCVTRDQLKRLNNYGLRFEPLR